jgi:putative heme-binding domain-containing protein
MGAAGELAGSLLASSDRNEMLQGIELAEALRSPGLRGPLAKLVRDPSLGERERTAAIRALTAVDPRGALSELESVVVDASAPIETREQAAGALNGTGAPEAREALVRALPTAPGRLQTSIAIALASTAPGGESLLAAVAAGKASARLLQERAVEVRLGLLNLPNGNERLAKLLVGLPPTDSKLQDLLQTRRTSFAAAKVDLTVGEALFAKHCAACHQIGGKGARIGPQLDGVGVRGVDRLLEDVLDPNRNVDQAFRMTSLALANGEVVAGLLLREEGEVLILADSQGKEVRVPKASVEERTVSQLSPMPANLSDQVGEADFAHLLGYLLSRRPPAP